MGYDDWKQRAPEDEEWQFPRGVERTCAKCGELFYLEAGGDYISRPWCEDCTRTYLNALVEANRPKPAGEAA